MPSTAPTQSNGFRADPEKYPPPRGASPKEIADLVRGKRAAGPPTRPDHRAAALAAATSRVQSELGIVDDPVPDTPPDPPRVVAAEPTPMPPTPPRKTRAEEVLDHAEALRRADEPITAPAIAGRMGVTSDRVHSIVCLLRKQGRWPHGPAGPAAASKPPAIAPVPTPPKPRPAPPRGDLLAADSEVLAMATLARELLPMDESARRRVLVWLNSRFA